MSEPRPRRYVRRSATAWQRLVAEQQASGLSQRRFCEQRGLAVASFAMWRRRLRGQVPAVRSLATAAPAFVELALPPQAGAPPSWELELSLGDGVVLRLHRA